MEFEKIFGTTICKLLKMNNIVWIFLEPANGGDYEENCAD